MVRGEKVTAYSNGYNDATRGEDNGSGQVYTTGISGQNNRVPAGTQEEIWDASYAAAAREPNSGLHPDAAWSAIEPGDGRGYMEEQRLSSEELLDLYYRENLTATILDNNILEEAALVRIGDLAEYGSVEIRLRRMKEYYRFLMEHNGKINGTQFLQIVNELNEKYPIEFPEGMRPF